MVDNATRLQGVGYGNGAGPAIWVVISTVIIATSTMATQGHGFNMTSAITGFLLFAMHPLLILGT